MNLRVLAAVAGTLGGGCWIARWVAGSSAGWADGVHWAGLALLGVALAVVGAGLVSRSAIWLRIIVAVAFPALVWSVYTVLVGEGDGVVVSGVVGVLAVLCSLVAVVLRRSRGEREPRPRAGSHAA